MSNSHKGSTNGNKPNHSRLEKWNNELAFWRTKRYDPPSEDLPLSSKLWSYNVFEYETRLNKELLKHRNPATL